MSFVLPNVLLLSQDLTQDITSHLILSSSAPLDCDHFSKPRLWSRLDSWKYRSSGLSNVPLFAFCRMFSLWSDRVMGLGGEDHQEVRCPSHHIFSRAGPSNVIYVDFDLDCPVGYVYQISPLKSHSLRLAFPRCPLGGIHSKVTAHTFDGWEWWSSLKGVSTEVIWKFFCVWNMSILLYLEKNALGEG